MQADNPVMSVVPFLAGVVSLSVAPEAAKSAMHKLTS
jgi:SWI/SNF related-matrix-associated actin-dependent regulator of chromatin subfamily C